MTNYGFKVSKAGNDVKTASDSNLILTSKFPFFKAYLQGSFSVTVTGAGTFTNTFTHSLGYHPAYFHLEIPDPNNSDRRTLASFAAAAVGQIMVDSYTTTTQLTIGWQDTSAGFFHAFPYTVYFYYYIFYDQLA